MRLLATFFYTLTRFLYLIYYRIIHTPTVREGELILIN